MQVRNVGKWACMLVIAWAGSNAVVACGGSGNGSVFVDGGTGPDDSSVGPRDATSSGGDGPSLVGDDGGGNGDSGGCIPKTCAQLNYDCGKAVSCGQVIDCTGTGTGTGGCTPPESCGGGGTANVCGGASTADGGPVQCTPTTCNALNYNCGFASDGCGDALNCNPNDAATGCTPPQYCGGGGFNVCGGSNGLQPDGGVPCTSKTCLGLGYDCGYANDSCGNLLDCNPPSGACPNPQYCGGGGFNVCGGNNGLGVDGAPNCKPSTCAKQGFNCGFAGDGCGGLLTCPTCSGILTCGGGGVPGVCGNNVCTGLCLQQAACGGGVQTTIQGTVIAGTLAKYGKADPVPNVIVYVPNAALQAFTPGATCSQCGAQVTGSPLVETTTAFDGTFTLKNVPSNVPPGAKIPVVIQLGRWRRTFLYDIPSCATTQLGNLVMPHNSGEGDIPLTAIATGSVDSIECVLLKMGVDQAEFTKNTTAPPGRIHLYSTASDYSNANTDGAGASLGNTTPGEAALMGNGGTFMNYDQILFPCWGARFTKTAAELGNLVTYANSGGHFFATHFSYSWLFQNNPFNTVANWNVDADYANGKSPPASVNANVNLPPTNLEGTVFSNWLHLVGAMPNPQTVNITFPRHDVNTVVLPSVDWIDGHDTVTNSFETLHFTFNTPVGQASQCGHVIYSDFHVTNTADSPATVFPAECDANGLTAQEKVLEYMIWDLASCVPGPPTPPTCTPITCADQNISCGPAGDGCGNAITSCGTCTPPQTCGGGGTPGKCGAPDGGTCVAQTCQQQNISCGPAGDGCGNEIPNCGNCVPPQTCGGGGVGGQCGFPEAGSCQPETCAQQMIFCGPAGDGCGNEIPSCGTCTPPQTCGGGGTPGVCGALDAGSCTPKSCAAQGIQCGTASDTCGNVLQCPNCPSGQTCNTLTGMCVQTSQ
jgi:hypothetical protein